MDRLKFAEQLLAFVKDDPLRGSVHVPPTLNGQSESLPPGVRAFSETEQRILDVLSAVDFKTAAEISLALEMGDEPPKTLRVILQNLEFRGAVVCSQRVGYRRAF